MQYKVSSKKGLLTNLNNSVKLSNGIYEDFFPPNTLKLIIIWNVFFIEIPTHSLEYTYNKLAYYIYIYRPSCHLFIL